MFIKMLSSSLLSRSRETRTGLSSHPQRPDLRLGILYSMHPRGLIYAWDDGLSTRCINWRDHSVCGVDKSRVSSSSSLQGPRPIHNRARCSEQDRQIAEGPHAPSAVLNTRICLPSGGGLSKKGFGSLDKESKVKRS